MPSDYNDTLEIREKPRKRYRKSQKRRTYTDKKGLATLSSIEPYYQVIPMNFKYGNSTTANRRNRPKKTKKAFNQFCERKLSFEVSDTLTRDKVSSIEQTHSPSKDFIKLNRV